MSRGLSAERCLAVLVDGDRLRLFRIDRERVEELREASLPAPGDGNGKGDASAATAESARRGARSGRAHVCTGHNLPVVAACDYVHRAADRVARVARAEHIDRILAGGAPDCVAELLRILRTRLGGDIEALPIPATASAVQVGEAAAASRAEPTSREEEVLGELIDAVGRGLAVFGPAAVTEAVTEHRAALLIIPRAAGPGGAVCPACDALFASPPPAACPACGEQPVPAPDFLDRLARLVREQGGEVEEITGPAGEPLRAYGGLAALLRYTFPGAGRACPWSDGAEREADELAHEGSRR